MNPQPPRATPRPSPQPLDPRTLGRPVHLLPRFAEQLGEALGELFLGHNRRYRAQYEIGAISIKPVGPEAVAGRWMVGEAAHGRVACLAERALVLNLMAHRYGNAGAGSSEPPAETATEERMLSWLCLQSLQCALRLIGEPADAAATPTLQPSLQPQLSAGSWFIQISVRELGQGLQSQLLLALDPLYIGKLLKRLGQTQPQPPKADTQQLAKQLKLKLEARLLEQTLPLGELLDLRPGDLIPVRLKSTDVLVDGALLFTASVAEHQGKLCLTSFVDAE
ncbi:FliM/FliN family flagellar motor C-terminal domain-containing protein [Paucibacter sp. M5-1]|uniref:FliM/FliN family flagellar motor C-terminal domain-containing protein n=1 Tax=Paucibacter sp. M5-1 TaxID=3015998 RepID=UPI0022B8DC8C|nr:FliM/FliN family flagellar motor C-terminal domain-containing protein [Paucibacter sp. M5-1]MCZ7884653.1 FliM/FliN family flagellar motor C-terminal domain-containing protein [Paucibacter sp. M5-1]